MSKNNGIHGAGKVDKNDTAWGQANTTGMPPDQKINITEELTYLSINTGSGDA